MPATKPKVRPVKLICAVLYSESVDLDSIDKDLNSRFGDIDLRSPDFDFDLSDYYENEMGKDLKKRLYSYEKLVMPDDLADIKNATVKIESKYSSHNKRPVNLDPGYLEESKLVLASTKNFSHRIYLKDGIWGELTLSYAKGNFVIHPWTYPDYVSELAFESLRETREIYSRQLKAIFRS